MLFQMSFQAPNNIAWHNFYRIKVIKYLRFFSIYIWVLDCCNFRKYWCLFVLSKACKGQTLTFEFSLWYATCLCTTQRLTPGSYQTQYAEL